MATPIRQFNVDLYREHLEEASFLYDQRRAYLHDPEVNWRDLDEWESRFEAHIDALVTGGRLALDVSRKHVADGDLGGKHAALRVLCRQDQKDDAFAVLGAVDPTDADAVRAVAEAVYREAPTGWRDELVRMLQGDQHQLTPVVARVLGYRRFGSEEVLWRKLAQKPSVGTAELAWALGRVGSASSVPLLTSLLDVEDGNVSEIAAIALMRLGDDKAIQRAMRAAPFHSWARRVLGIGGPSTSARLLLDVLKGPNADADTVIALGLIGDVSAVAPLIDLLDHEELKKPAAVALNTITGAQLYARVFVPDTFDPEELFPDERAAFEKDGTLPRRDGTPYGNWERRALQSKEGWHAWLDQNKQHFSRDVRWRMGKPYGPAALFECLAAETTPYTVRAASYEELVVRFGLDVPFEVDLLVSQQLRFLVKIKEWVARQPKLAAGRYSSADPP